MLKLLKDIFNRVISVGILWLWRQFLWRWMISWAAENLIPCKFPEDPSKIDWLYIWNLESDPIVSASFPESYDLYQVSTKSVSIWQPLAKKLISHSLLTFLHKNSGVTHLVSRHLWTSTLSPGAFKVWSANTVIEVRSVNTDSYRGSNSWHSPPGITGFIPSGYRRVVEVDSSTHVDWLLSRLLFYNYQILIV